jgi:5-methyltetrahydrofolate--homocysteine methyltransferase
MAELSKLYDAIVRGDQKAAVDIIRQALAESVDPLELVTQYMTPAMDEVGRRFQCQEVFVPGLVLGGRAMKAALEILRPELARGGAQPTGRVVIGTVKGDLHDIGKNLVASMLEGGGFEVVDLGTDVRPERFVEAVEANKADIVALSALLTVTMPAMKHTIEAFEKADLRGRIKVMIGGAPVTQQYADSIGADGYGEDAIAGVALARQLVARNTAV